MRTLLTFLITILCFLDTTYSLGHSRNHVSQPKTFRTTPWLTDESIEFLEEYLKKHPNAKVLEFGSGASTIWFAKRTRNLFSIEHHPRWYNLIKKKLRDDPKCQRVRYFLLKKPYYTFCDVFRNNFFDIIIVDGRNRKGCIVHAVKKLKPNGVLLLDDSQRDYYHAAFNHMKGWKRKDTEMKGPDAFGFFQKGKQTTWWIKPARNSK